MKKPHIGTSSDADQSGALAIEESLVGTNPRDRLAIRLQSLRDGERKNKQIIKELEAKTRKKKREAAELMQLGNRKIAYITIFKTLVKKYLGFEMYQILSDYRSDPKEITALEEIIIKRAKRNLLLGLGACIVIPVLGWTVLAFSLFEDPDKQDNWDYDSYTINYPLMLFRLKKKLQKQGINTSDILAKSF